MDLSDSFAWNEYLEKTGGTPAAWECFKQNRTPPENLFQVDSILEAVDQRIALNEIPPPQPPFASSASGGVVATASNGVAPSSIASTSTSSEATSSTPASTSPSLSSTSVAPRRRRFSVTGGGQQLRRFRSAPFSLARVIETAGPRLRVRLVGTDDRNDCWFLVDSDEIRPYPSHETLQPPFGYVHNHLVWNKTLRRTVEEGKAAPAECFAKPPPDPERNLFKKGDKLEAVDRHNAQLICPATIGEVSGLHVLISFDGWSGNFDYWTRYDSRDLFPCGWCKLAGHALQSPGPAAIQHLNLTPTKMPVPRPPDSSSASSSSLSKLSVPTQAHANPITVSVRKSASSRRKRLTMAGGSSRRPRLSATEPVTRCVLDTVLTIKPEKVAVSTPIPIATPSTTAITTTSTTSTTVASPPQPPLPRLTVITKTLEDGSPQTIIKATSSTTSTSSSDKSNHCHASVEGGSPIASTLLPLPSDAEFDSADRKHKKSKKHKRHSSKESHHKHLNSDLHRSVSFSDLCKPTKLVIRQRPGDLSGSTTQLFVDTLDTSPPPLLAPFSTKFSPSIVTSSQRSPTPVWVGSNGDPPFLGRTQMASQSTVSPASMDLGPCPLPNVTEWSTDDVYNYLISKDPSLVEIANTFKEQEIDGSALLLLDIETMRSLLSMKLGPALKIDDIVNRLKRGHL
ncbi:polycomb protein SCMH1 [Echinococcus multilocularis]|uniref:Polycomb protein SCMH1 n=1 Tax=Echinococcus multilocularis TaxID=6211 RepID=A0A068Y2A4_ECHMU|nr:polycomb protein SCMH1 [Echinococcus multilocularis]